MHGDRSPGPLPCPGPPPQEAVLAAAAGGTIDQRNADGRTALSFAAGTGGHPSCGGFHVPGNGSRFRSNCERIFQCRLNSTPMSGV